MNTLMMITLTVGVSVYAVYWHNQDAHLNKQGSLKLERELLWPRRKPGNKQNQRLAFVLFWFGLAWYLAGMSLVAAEPPFESPASNSASGLKQYLHLSCAGMNNPNLGLNTVVGMVGLSWFF